MAGGDNKNTSYESGIGWAILGGVLFCLLLLFWHYFQYEIKSVFRWLRWAEMWLVSFFVGKGYSLSWGDYQVDFHQWLNAVPGIPAQNLDKPTLTVISLLAMEPLKRVFQLLIGLMGLWALMYGPGTQYRRKLNLDGLIHAQKGNFSVIAPFDSFNPASDVPPRPPGAPVPAVLPDFAEALAPEEWLVHNRIPVDPASRQIDEQAAREAFARQLGGRWQGVKGLPPHRQVLLAAFCLKAVRKRKESEIMLGRIAQCWSHEKGLVLRQDSTLLSDARKVLADKKISGGVLAKCNYHAFQTTALMRALVTAREEGGVLAPAEFVWLRAHDRALWYPLNNLGRHAFHMESLGAMAHFKAERLTQRPIPRPKADDSVKALSSYMRSPNARPLPQLDTSPPPKKKKKKKK